jgi:allophanate hydrolase subunit 2
VREVEHSRVYSVEPGERITFGEKQYGMRTYFCFRIRTEGDGIPHISTVIPFSNISGWADPLGRIRVLSGPEYDHLENPQLFFDNVWQTTSQMDKMGMRLAGKPRLKCNLVNMVSEAVADGTVQLTPDGPIILLRHRQTTGGYPRIFNVITADIDLLGQYSPNQVIRFMPVSRDEACEFARQKEMVLEQIRCQLENQA